ncbi:hypothetical protein ANN_24542 [Periplaneta americana]|uniref:Uncharacterized protein n=1 Tax=Periplaneta americana TaxID=6978 RepID=A0ABQ8S3K7_PERAM|nr:hypothetical protein ANN_24542 [Periplaneta americana]
MDYWRRSAGISRRDEIRNDIIREKMEVKNDIVEDIFTKQLVCAIEKSLRSSISSINAGIQSCRKLAFPHSFRFDNLTPPSPTMWLPRSPNLNPADVWLWGYLKERVFLTRPTTLLQLKDAISQEIANIPRHYLQNAVHGVSDRMLYVEQENGGHLPNVL